MEANNQVFSSPASLGSKHPIRILLVDDQAMIGEAIRRMLAPESDIQFLYCGDPTKALQIATEYQPTVILQDLVMPEVDGLTMLRFFRANPTTRDIPLIVLSTKEEPKTKGEAFTLGASDYLVKLPDPIELIARVRMHSRGYISQLERNEAYAALKRSEERLAEELAEAAKYLTSLLPAPMQGPISTEWRFIPSAELGGDTFGYEWLDSDHFAMYVLDVCGHGLKAALLSISAMNVLRNKTLPSTDFGSPGSVLCGLNEAFQMDRHNNMYFTIWYAVFNRQTRELRFAGAGHPPALLLQGESMEAATLVELSNPGLMMGAFPGVKYEDEVVVLPKFSQIYFFSDGVFEITRPDESMLTFEEFRDVIAASPRDGGAVANTIAAIREVRGSNDFEDDVSLVEVTL